MFERPKKIWTSTDIIDLPYIPFESGDKTERGIIDYIANSIIKVSRIEQRKGITILSRRQQNFDNADTIVGIDVSNIRYDQRSYLDNLLMLTRIYPFILINCSIRKEHLLTLPLHSELNNRGYILPVFRRIAPNDVLFSTKRYGQALNDLLKGDREKISIKELKGINELYSLEDIRGRFPGIEVSGDQICYIPEVIWLGVESEELSTGLGELFRKNMAEFETSEFCREYSVDPNVLGKYQTNSMLFGKNTEGTYYFRLHRKNVFQSFMRGLVEQFESEMINRGVIDTTHSDYAGNIGSFIEFHSIGRLFDQRDKFAFKMLSYIWQCFAHLSFNKIVLVDNGKEFNLHSLIGKVFNNTTACRVINYFNEPVMFPFDQIVKGDKVLIITDVINSGEFIGKVVSYLHKTIGAEILGIFSFIIDVRVDTKNILSLINGKNRAELFYYVEKQLDRIQSIRQIEHEKRFRNTGEEAYLLFWNTVGSMCNVKTDHIFDGLRITTAYNLATNIRTHYCQSFIIKENPEKFIKENDHFLLYLKKLYGEFRFSVIVMENEPVASAMERIFRLVENSVEVIVIRDKRTVSDLRDRLRTHRKILIFMTALNVGEEFIGLIKNVKRNAPAGANILGLGMFSRKNVFIETKHLSDEYQRNIMAEGIEIRCSYNSNLPYYLINADVEDHKYIELSLQKISVDRG